MDLANIISDFIDDPFKFLIGFVMLLVPSSLFVWLLIGGELLKETGHNFIGTALIFILGAFGNLTLWLVTTFIESVVYLVIIVFLIGTVLSALGIKK